MVSATHGKRLAQTALIQAFIKQILSPFTFFYTMKG